MQMLRTFAHFCSMAICCLPAKFADDKCSHFIPHHPSAFFCQSICPNRDEKCLKLKTIAWWKQVFFCCENGIFSPTKRHTIDRYINISCVLIQLEWTPQSSRVISSKGHFSHPDPDVPSLSSASVSPTTLCPPKTFCSATVCVSVH